ETGLRGVLYAALVFDLAAEVLSLINLAGLLTVHKSVLPALLDWLQAPLELAAGLLFVVFLKHLALVLSDEKLVRRARFVLRIVVALGTLLVFFYAEEPDNPLRGPNPFVLLLAVVIFLLDILFLILYGNLLTYFRTALLQRVRLA